jgi:hypothetical protein
MALDNNGILVRNGEDPTALHIQDNGGNTYFGYSGGDTYLAHGGGSVGINTPITLGALSVDDEDFQIYLRNDAGGSINDWYIGTSNNSWFSGDNQLLFSPTSSSGDAVLRLLDVIENDGQNAPVMIHTTEDQTILLDGNEIDTRGVSLYINHNSDNKTAINPSGGKVGIGTTAPEAMVHVVGGNPTMALQRDGMRWHISPQSSGTGSLIFGHDDNVWCDVDGNSGQWNSLSDERRKENIFPMPSLLDPIMSLPVYNYSFVHDETHAANIGIMAQDLLPNFPALVTQHEGLYGVAYAQLAVVALRAIQDQQIMIDSLKQRIAALKGTTTAVDTVISTTN